MNTTVDCCRVEFFLVDLFIYIVIKWPHLKVCKRIFLRLFRKDLSFYGQMQPFISLVKPPPDMTSPPRGVCRVCFTGAFKENSSGLKPHLSPQSQTVLERRKIQIQVTSFHNHTLSHSHVSLHQPVHAVDWPSVSAEQDDDLDNNDQSRKTPAQEKIQQIATLGVLVIHHQHLPEVHRL